MDNNNPFDGFDMIHSYTRSQALEDGVLVDLAPLAREAGFRCSVAVTRAVFEVLDPRPELLSEGQSFQGRAWDLLTVLRHEIDRASAGAVEISISPLFVMAPGESPAPIAMRSVAGPGDAGELVITIMLPEED